MSDTDAAAREHGNRAAFLANARRRLRRPVPPNHAHPRPEPTPVAPLIGYHELDPEDLLGTFVRVATDVGTVVHTVDEEAIPARLLVHIAATHDVARAVVSDQPEALAAIELLEPFGLEVGRATLPALAEADLGITSATALIAATGSIVLRSSAVGSRTVSLLPRVHLCIVPASRIVASPADVLRPLRGQPGLLPSNLLFITGPSRTGDIEQILTTGVHGPTAVHVVITGCGTGSERVHPD